MNPRNIFHSNSIGSPIDAIQIFQMIILKISCNFLLPSFVRVLFYNLLSLQTEHRVGEDVGFDIRDLIDFVTQQALHVRSSQSIIDTPMICVWFLINFTFL